MSAVSCHLYCTEAQLSSQRIANKYRSRQDESWLIQVDSNVVLLFRQWIRYCTGIDGINRIEISRYGRRRSMALLGCLQFLFELAFAHVVRIRTSIIVTMEGHAQNAYRTLRKSVNHSPDKYIRYSACFFFRFCWCTVKVLAVRLAFVSWHFFGLLSFD